MVWKRQTVQGVLKIGDLTVKNHGFAEVIGETGLAFAYTKFDGVLGLGWDLTSVNGSVPPFYNMLDWKLLDEPVFAFCLGHEKDSSEATFGGVDKICYTGDLTTIPLRCKAYWEVDFDGIAVDSKLSKLENTGVILDTGPFFITVLIDMADIMQVDLF